MQEEDWRDEELEMLIARLYGHNWDINKIASHLHIWNVTVSKILRRFYTLKLGRRHGKVIMNPNFRGTIEM